MQIFNLNKNDSGEYACRAANAYGELWGNFTLQVVKDEGILPVSLLLIIGKDLNRRNQKLLSVCYVHVM